MFGWITGGRIRELEGKLDRKVEDYARVMTDCYELRREIVRLEAHLEDKNHLVQDQKELIGELDAICREQKSEFQRLYAKCSRPSRDPVTGRYMKRTDKGD